MTPISYSAASETEEGQESDAGPLGDDACVGTSRGVVDSHDGFEARDGNRARRARGGSGGRRRPVRRVATVTAGASRPRVLTVSVLATPSQRITLVWSVHCSNGFDAGSKTGKHTAVAPLTHRFTFPTSSPATCTAHASAQLSHDGRLTVKIIRG